MKFAPIFTLLFLSALLPASRAQTPPITPPPPLPPPLSPPPPSRPDPAEISLPEIKTSLGTLPGPDQLPTRKELPDVLTMNDGSKVTTPAQWARRRDEMKTILEYYAVGQAPPPPGNVHATELRSQLLANGKIKYRLIHLTFGPASAPQSLSLDIGLYTPAAPPSPVGVVIGQDGSPPGAARLARLPQGPNQGRGQDVLVPPLPTTVPAPAAAPARPGALVAEGPADLSAAERTAANNVPLAHGYAYLTFDDNDCAEDTTLRNPDGSFAFRSTRFYPAYPGYDWGVLRGWAWGVSRIVDYLQTDASIDKSKIIVTGVSRAGKSALIAGAFDERISMVAPVASSGGGTPAFRFSGTDRGGNEGLTEMVRKYPNWFSPHLHEFWGQPDKLPFDQHWLIALVAPRPFIALEGLSDQNVNKVGVHQSFLAAAPAFALLNAPDRLGINWSQRPHGLVQDDWDALFAFADQHVLHKPTTRPFNQFPEAALATPKFTQ